MMLEAMLRSTFRITFGATVMLSLETLMLGPNRVMLGLSTLMLKPARVMLEP